MTLWNKQTKDHIDEIVGGMKDYFEDKSKNGLFKNLSK